MTIAVDSCSLAGWRALGPMARQCEGAAVQEAAQAWVSAPMGCRETSVLNSAGQLW